MNHEWLQRLVPRSLLSRTLLLTLLSVVLAQVIATSIWYTQSKRTQLAGLESASASLANMFASTTTFFQSLPVAYRHIALNQLRNMGGTRFFVSFNKEKITITPIEETQAKQVAVNTVSQVLEAQLPALSTIDVEFSRPETLRVLNNDILLRDLPKSWAHHTLSLEPLNPPILVVQMELKSNEWIYIAALLPAPYVTLDDTLITADQVVFIVVITALLLLFTYSLIRQQARPLKRLAKAANLFSTDIEQPPLKEEGAAEIAIVTRAFNRMQRRLQRHLRERETLFRSMSHDLKTPITRLRLRAELIDDDIQAAKMNKDLDELEIMVKGAVQTVRDTDIHENMAEIDVIDFLAVIAEPHNQDRVRVTIECEAVKGFTCKPLAFKRCLSNLIDNGVKYGEQVTIYVMDAEHTLDITLIDQGPGIPEEELDSVFDPYVRLHTDNEGSGLGLGIARDIIHAHGGDMVLSNRNEGGLQVDISFPRVEE
ncbi:two-component sensor histidine kinase [Salinivibrio sp. IB574]|uniref:ATP-binding protein n=1 Tax=Salinivibrio sp. IB574 TaxID=1909444 RepID=UPI00098954E0|nr:ATP-binding protein [Salinivibrio sp. IB574]OOF22077.1 two-component sensor histidine kinase [Salinivibrio sp. IB574]